MLLLFGNQPGVTPPPTPIIPPELDPTARYVTDLYQEPSIPRWREHPMSGPTFCYEYLTGAELPALRIPWADRDGFDVDFTVGWLFTVTIGSLGSVPLIAKTSGIVGGVGYIDISWSADVGTDLDLLPVGRYDMQINARRASDMRDRRRLGELVISRSL